MTSRRPRLKISSISTVQRPIPRRDTSRLISSSSDNRTACRRVGTTPARRASHTARIAAALEPEKPHPRNAVSGSASNASGPGNAPWLCCTSRRSMASAARACSCWWAMARTRLSNGSRAVSARRPQRPTRRISTAIAGSARLR